MFADYQVNQTPCTAALRQVGLDAAMGHSRRPSMSGLAANSEH